jgi:hypothetical protein
VSAIKKVDPDDFVMCPRDIRRIQKIRLALESKRIIIAKAFLIGLLDEKIEELYPFLPFDVDIKHPNNIEESKKTVINTRNFLFSAIEYVQSERALYMILNDFQFGIEYILTKYSPNSLVLDSVK